MSELYQASPEDLEIGAGSHSGINSIQNFLTPDLNGYYKLATLISKASISKLRSRDLLTICMLVMYAFSSSVMTYKNAPP